MKMTLRKTTSGIVLAAFAAALGTAVPAQDAPGAPPAGDAPRMFGLAQFDAIDADKDGKVTEAELEAFRTARFTEADTDKDGLLGKDELAAMQLKMMQERMADRAAQMLARLDADKDGKLSAAEMPAERFGARMFDMADADNDGAVSKDEMQQAMDWIQDHRGGKRGDRDGRGGWHGEGRGHGDGWGWWN